MKITQTHNKKNNKYNGYISKIVGYDKETKKFKYEFLKADEWEHCSNKYSDKTYLLEESGFYCIKDYQEYGPTNYYFKAKDEESEEVLYAIPSNATLRDLILKIDNERTEKETELMRKEGIFYSCVDIISFESEKKELKE